MLLTPANMERLTDLDVMSGTRRRRLLARFGNGR
jgi:hypothetical protein